MFKNLVNLYNANGKLHSFVVTVEYAVLGFVLTYTGGWPTSKTAWSTLGAAVAGVLWGSFKGWLRNNVATN